MSLESSIMKLECGKGIHVFLLLGLVFDIDWISFQHGT